MMEKVQNKWPSFSLLEIIVAVAVFSIFAVSMVTAIVGVHSDYDKGSDRLQANYLLSEGMEAVRSIRDQDWDNLSDGSYGVTASSGSWAFNGTGTTVGAFTRSVTLTAVGATRYDVTVTVFWYTQEEFYMERTLTGRLTNWIFVPTTALSMMVYDTRSITAVPKYRVWDGSGWGAEASANAVGGDIRHMVLKYAPTRDEAILATLGSTGAIYAQVYDGTGATWGTPVFIGEMRDPNNNGDGQSRFRGFDIEYEQSSGDAVIVYGDASADPDYRVWDGSSWSAASDINVPTTGAPSWVEMASGSGTDVLAFILVDSNTDIYGMGWNGSAWGAMGAATAWDTSGSIATKKSVDVAIETTSGDLLFMWGDSVSTDQYYRTYSGGSLSAATLLDNAQAGGLAQWVQLVSNRTPGSDEIMYGVQDAGGDLNTFLWSGAGWSAVHTEHDATTEDIADMNFEIVFETHSSNADDAWLVWADGATVSRKRWDGPTDAWAAATTSGDDSASMQMAANPNDGAVLATIYEDDTSATDDLTQMNLTGGVQVWNAASSIWSGPVVRNLALTKMSVAAQGYNSSIEGMMAYDSQDVTTTPKYRLWDGSAWGDESSANDIGGEIRHMVIKYAPTRDEAIMVVMGSTGAIQAQVWDGTSATWGAVTTLGEHVDTNGSGDNQSLRHSFDIEYEQSSGDAVVVYGDGTADPNYKVWDGTGWSAASDINIPTTGNPAWIEVASGSGTDVLGFIMIDANVDVYGMLWDGSAWGNMGAATVWDATAVSAGKKSVDVAFEKNSGDLMYIWGDVTSTDQYYRTYSGGVLSAATLLDNAQAGGAAEWVKLASNPTLGSDEIMYGVLDAGADLNTFMWSGTGWSAVHAEHDATTEDIADLNFDIVFETHSSNPDDAWLGWGDDATVSRKLWDGATDAWGVASTAGDDTAHVVANANPDNGDVLVSIYLSDTSASDVIAGQYLTGGSQTWTSAGSFWDGPVARGVAFIRMSIDSSAFNTP